MFTLPPLPYKLTALEPFFSAETLEYHYGKHHQAYIDKLNSLVQGTPEETKTLEDILVTTQP
jgi:Fe-Mn family superoxide dismutase